MHEGSRRAVVAAFSANVGIAAAKFVAFFFTGAASILAEAVHSVADTGNQALLFLGSARAQRAATEEHPFGFGRERYFWAFVVALVLFSLGSLFAIGEGIEKLRTPHELESPIWAIAVLGISIVLETFSLHTAVREANAVRGRQSWWSFVRHTKSPELPVVLLEDMGALLGQLVTREDCRRQGFARALAATLACALETRERRVVAHVREGAQPAEHLLTQLGFRGAHEFAVFAR